MHNGTVKWFNNAKGYGFIVSDHFDEDLFSHYSTINIDGYKTLKAGQSVSFEVSPGQRGLHAVNITPLSTDATPLSKQATPETALETMLKE